MDCQLLHQKCLQKISVIKTNTFVCFFVVFKTKRELECHNKLFFWKYQFLVFGTDNFWQNFWHNNWQSIFDIVERLITSVCLIIHSLCKVYKCENVFVLICRTGRTITKTRIIKQTLLFVWLVFKSGLRLRTYSR